MTALRDYLDGTIPATVALMRLMLQGASAESVIRHLTGAAADDDRLLPLLALAQRMRDGLWTLQRMVEAGATHAPCDDPEAAIAQSRAMFDRLVRISPEASVAAYSLGDPELLDAITMELVVWLRAQGLLARRPRILDLGCGIGRLAGALARDAGSVTGLDIAPAMIDEARRRNAALPGLRFETCSGRDLAGMPDACCDLVLAVDVFPYLVGGGLPLATGMVTEAARVLRPGGDLLILNFSYRGPEADRRDLPGIAAQAGFDLHRNGTREFLLWDGLVHWLRRHHAGA
ncbi:class I SAM-dependent methyltransferase [Paracraurococcus lichenis]|uniref:Class I SAM-dependent methyltransferase n=1 Tax=Paracraurococcus lichenis TaxID=3064888 RepID=A0ABT9E7Z2_9PROT|nr:class I SAM-dependent methyltransferase [Paracraurococcus sp. LOR1-02]MDO9712326.1 class I SAM-dependent methyltransferase [Paracraurococcus sp. LOR1-02]